MSYLLKNHNLRSYKNHKGNEAGIDYNGKWKNPPFYYRGKNPGVHFTQCQVMKSNIDEIRKKNLMNGGYKFG
jgi:hypothetical protein